MHVAGAKSSAEGIGIETTLFATTEDNKPALGGNIRFTGMAVYFTSWAEAGIETVKSDNKNKEGRSRNESNEEEVTSDMNYSEKKQYDNSEIIFKERTWPEKGQSKQLGKDGL